MRDGAARDPGLPGPDPPVTLLLPGMTLNASVFPDLDTPTVAMDFTRLVVGPDGWSAELAERRMGFYADLLTHRLRQDQAWTKARRRVVVGHSFGGMLALAWLLEQRGSGMGRVDGLVLVATTAGPMFHVARVRLGGVGARELRIPAGLLMPLWNHPGLTRWLGTWATRRSGGPVTVNFRALPRTSDAAVGLAGWSNTDWRARRSFRIAMNGFDVRPRLGQLDLPTIVLHGDRDAFFSVGVARALAAGLPRGELRLVPGAAHLLPLTHPDAVRSAVRDVLERPPGRRWPGA